MHKNSKEYLVTFSDLKLVCKRAKKKIWTLALIGAFIGALYTLSQPIRYYGEGSFREKAKADSPEKSLSTVLTGGGTSAENVAISTLKSRKIAEKAALELNLQAEVTPKSPLPKPIAKAFDALKNIGDHLRVEYALLRGRQRPSLKDTIADLTAEDIVYQREVALQLELYSISRTEFEVVDPEEGPLGVAVIGLPFNGPDFSFTLLQNAVEDLSGKSYYLTLRPLDMAAKKLSDETKVQSDRLDKGLIRLTVLDKNRYLASESVNALMNAYRSYLIEEHQRQAQDQIAYLHKRREEMGEKLKQTLEEHAENLSSNGGNIEFLIATKQGYQKRLLAIDLEAKHLQKALLEGASYLEKHASDSGNQALHKFAAEIATLKQQADAIESIREKAPQNTNAKQDYQGISLETAEQLYLTYSKELHEAETARLQTRFILEQLENPDFELSSLSASLNDPVSREMVSKASTLSLAVKDEDNRTSKEILRLNQELDLQKTFLKGHLTQVVQLSELTETLLRQKIASLQSAILSLISQKIAILEKHLQDFARSEINGLAREKEVIEQHSDEIQKELASLPTKWASQKIVDQQMEINKRIVQDIASLVEQKNIYGNVELSQSAPLDTSLVQVYPKSPYTLIFALFGAFLAAAFTISWVFVRSVGKGIEAAPQNLALIGETVLGTLSKKFSQKPSTLLDNDLNVLRHTVTFFDKRNSEVLLVVQHESCLIAEKVAELLAGTGKKVLLLPLSFETISPKDELPGLLSALDGEVEKPKITLQNGYYKVSEGGVDRFAFEKTSSKKFEELLSELKSGYDVVILYSLAKACSADAKGQFLRYKTAVVALKGESLDELTPYFSDEKAKAGFIFES